MLKKRPKSYTSPSLDQHPAPNVSKTEEDHKPTSKSPSLKGDFTFCLIFRVANSLLIQTYFNPDEHWQALEVAHRIAFGYGHLTWEWSEGIRSYLHPMVFVVLYKVLAFLGLDTPWFMAKAPRLLQSIFSVVGDLYNSLVTSLMSVLLGGSLLKWGFVVATLACAIRPTSAITWLYVGLLELFATRDRLHSFFSRVIGLALTFLLDRWMYGLRIFVPLNFICLASTTDSFDVLWVFISYAGKPGSSDSKRKIPLTHSRGPSRIQLTVFFLIVSNLPMAFYMSLVHQRGSEDLMNFLSKEALDDKVESVLVLMPHATPRHALLFDSAPQPDHAFLRLPTPYYSTLHRSLPMHFLDCSPSEKGGPDESDRFMMDPVGFVFDLVKHWSLPSHIVLLEPHERKLKEFQTSHSYKELKRFFHAHFKVDRDLQASVVVYTRMGQ